MTECCHCVFPPTPQYIPRLPPLDGQGRVEGNGVGGGPHVSGKWQAMSARSHAALRRQEPCNFFFGREREVEGYRMGRRVDVTR